MSRNLISIALVMGCLSAATAAPQATQKQSKATTADQKSSRKEKAGPATGKVDLNNASEKDLDSLPGVGPATAKKIIDHRPYRSVDDLAKAGIATNVIEKIRPMVTPGNTPSASIPAPVPVPNVPSQPAVRPTPVPAPTASTNRSTSAPSTPPPAAGSGMVWVNTETKIYHREGDRWYGKTKHGTYMTEADAIRAGNRAEKTR